MQVRLFSGLQKLEQIRAKEKVFSSGANVYTYDVHNDAILGVLREKDGEWFLGLFNFSGMGQTAWMQEEESFTELFTGKTMKLEDPYLAPHGFCWLKRVK